MPAGHEAVAAGVRPHDEREASGPRLFSALYRRTLVANAVGGAVAFIHLSFVSPTQPACETGYSPSLQVPLADAAGRRYGSPISALRRQGPNRTGRRRGLLAFLGCCVVLGACGNSEDQAGRAAAQKAPPPPEEPGDFDLKPRPKAVDLEGAGKPQAPESPSDEEEISPGAQSDREVRAELKAARQELKSFSSHLNSASLATGAKAKILPDGTAQAPRNAPPQVQRVILAANEIAKFPYKWGGGHGAWRDDGYDCSGSVSFALAGARLLKSPLASGGFMNYGAAGAGRWITIYTNPGHMFMVVAGLRFDTSGRGRKGTRWQPFNRGVSGFTVRHPPRF